MKRILGLDLGSSSIGWAIVELGVSEKKIVNMGSRIIPLTPDDEAQFTKGQAITKNADRTNMRTARKTYDRYQMRRGNLKKELSFVGVVPAEIVKPIDLWMLRSKAATEKIELSELGRVLLHINQKRGYRAGKEDYSDASSSKYVQTVNGRYRFLLDNDLTIGQYLYSELLKDGSFRVKDLVYPRAAYIAEFDAIIATQRKYYPETLTDEFVHKIKNETIFYQRRLKSCKHLVSICEFEKREYTKPDGTVILSGPRVAPKSSPVAQLCKVWEFVNTISVKNKQGNILYITPEKKSEIADYLKTNIRIKTADIYKILGVTKKEGWFVDKTVSQRNVGNTTYIRIAEALNGKYPGYLSLDINFDSIVDPDTGEEKKIVAENIKTEPLFRLWHTLYSIDEANELRGVLLNKFGISDEDVLDRLCKIDFVKEGYANKSNTAIRKILPYLMDGIVYSDACACAGYNHSNYVTKEENLKRELKDRLDPIKKGELRQPIVEKILNQTVNVVNSLLEQYGSFDEIRVELARELKQSREERENTTKMISKSERENKVFADKVSEYGFTPTRNRVLKMRLWEETRHLCIYCNQPVSASEFLSGIDVEKEHIIPRSLLFDNSSSNVTCACRRCNQEKNNSTAFDFMKAKGDAAFDEYSSRVNTLFDEHRISKAKRDKLLMSKDNIPTDFIERQLRETQYISKKALEMLRDICRNVYATSGSVTDFLRHTWGWDEILHDLHFEQYKAVGMTEMREISSNDGVRSKEVIKGWSKRLDHRHHAIDALTIACTSQSIIQGLNALNSLKDSPAESAEMQKLDLKGKYSHLEKYVLRQPHFSTKEVKEAVEDILVSYKSGKKVATPGKRYVYSKGKKILKQTTLVPRGALSEQTVYGKINYNGRDEIVVKQPVSSIDIKKAERIVDDAIKKIVIDYLAAHNGKYNDSEPVRDHQGHIIKSVRVTTGLDAVVAVRYDENHSPIGYVKPGNNHHIALYRDETGKIHESVVTFWNAVERKKYGLPIVIKTPDCLSLPDNLPDSLVSSLPCPEWKFIMSLQSNEMFVLGMSDEEFQEATKNNDFPKLSKFMYRVQSVSQNDYMFRHHLETSVDDKYNGEKDQSISRNLGKLIRVKSPVSLLRLVPHKVRISNIGNLIYD